MRGAALLGLGIAAALLWSRSANASPVDAPAGEGGLLAELLTLPDSAIGDFQDVFENATGMNGEAAGSAFSASPAVYDRLRRLEGFSATPYRDPPNQDKLWSIGYGYQLRSGEWWTSIDVPFAEQLLAKVVGEVQDTINSLVRVPLSQNQFDALTLFVYNIGQTQFRTSTLLKLLNQGDYQGAAAQFGRWVNGGGAVIPDLVARRSEESQLFLT